MRSVCAAITMALSAMLGGPTVSQEFVYTDRAVIIESPFSVDTTRETENYITPLDLDFSSYGELRNPNGLRIRAFPLDRFTKVDLIVQSFDVVSEDTVRVRGTATGDVPAAPVDLVQLRGEIAGMPESWVYLAISPMMVNGIIQHPDGMYVISSGPLDEGEPVIYRMSDLPVDAIDWVDWVCETVDEQQAQNRGDCEVPDPDPCRLALMAVESDTEFAQHFAVTPQDLDYTEAATQVYILTLVGAVSEIYHNDFNTTLELVYIRVWPDSAVSDPWNATNTPNALDELTDLWSTTPPFGGTWHGVHLFSAKALGGGIAYLSSLCDYSTPGFASAVSGNMTGYFPYPLAQSSQNWDVVVTAHEWGHTFGAPHTHGLNPPVDQCAFGDCSTASNGTIMSYCHLCPGGVANIHLNFHQRILDETIRPYLACETTCDLDYIGPECGYEICLADVNRDGMLSPADFSAWVAAYNAGDLAADVNQDGNLTPQDFSVWVQLFNLGCDF